MSQEHILVSFCNNPIPKRYSTVLVDLQTDNGLLNFKPVYLGFGKLIKSSTGISRGDGKIFILFSSWNRTYISILDEKGLTPIRYQELPEVNDPHSILFLENYVYIVSTGTDQVIRYKFGKNFNLINAEVIWCASHQKSDTHHINSIVEFNGDIIVSAFGPRNGKKWTSAMNGYIYNISKEKIVKENIYHPHTISIMDDDIYYCESRKSEFCSVNRGVIYKLNDYVRGVAWLKNDLVCIASSYRGKNNIFRRLITRITRKDFIYGRSNLFLLDTHSNQIISRVDLSFIGPEIYDLVNAADLSINY